jgi:hypothetical protein
VSQAVGVRMRVVGDLFHGRLPPPRPGVSLTSRARCAGLRASRYANRQRVGTCRVCWREHDQVDAVVAFAEDLAARPELVEAARRELTGDLACCCRTSPCHADVLLAVVAGTDPGQLGNRAAVLALAARARRPVGPRSGTLGHPLLDQ